MKALACRFLGVHLALITVLGCSSSPPVPSPEKPAESSSASPGAGKSAMAGPEAVLYLDSVPRGALVQAVDRDNQPIRELGRTPLTLKAADFPSRRFWVAFGTGEYLERCERSQSSLASWAAEFRKRLQTEGAVEAEFRFESRRGLPDLFATEKSGAVAWFGPVVQVDFPACNRACVPFLPRGLGPEDAFPLMPAAGTFPIESPLGLVRQGIPEGAAIGAFEQLSRCGYAALTAKTPKGRQRFVITINGPDDQNPLAQNLTMISVSDAE